MQPTVSVIVPVYNVEKYLARCVDSITSQTYENLDIILVDDGSTDNSGRICDEYAKKDTRIRVIHQKNKGASAARNCGITAASGNYIGFIDSDDWIDKDMYELLVNTAIEHHADIARCDTYLNYDDGTEKTNSDYSNVRVLDCVQAIKETVYTDINMSMCNKLFASYILKAEMFNESLICTEDWELNYRILKKNDTLISAYINLPKYHYYMRDGSATHSWSEKAIRDSFELFEKIYECEKEDVEVFPYACRGYVSHNMPIIKAAILAKKTKSPLFSYMIDKISGKEKDLLKHLEPRQAKIRLIAVCHFLWLYKLYIKATK